MPPRCVPGVYLAYHPPTLTNRFDFRPTDALLRALAPRLSAASQMPPACGVAKGDILERVGRCRPTLRAWVVLEDAVVPGSVPLGALGKV